MEVETTRDNSSAENENDTSREVVVSVGIAGQR